MATITKLHDNKELPVMGLMPTKLDQTKYPIILSSAEKGSIDFNHVITVLTNKAKSPYELAGVTDKNAPIFLKRFQEDYQTALENYENRGKLCGNADLRTVQKMKKEWAFERSPGTFILCATGGAAIGGGPLVCVAAAPIIVATVPVVVVAAVPVVVVVAAIGAAIGMAFANKKDTAEVQRECSSNRRTWLVEINTQEKTRIKIFKQALELRCTTLIDDLKITHSNNQTDFNRFTELKILEKAHANLTAPNQLQVKGQKVANFLLTNQTHY